MQVIGKKSKAVTKGTSNRRKTQLTPEEIERLKKDVQVAKDSVQAIQDEILAMPCLDEFKSALTILSDAEEKVKRGKGEID